MWGFLSEPRGYLPCWAALVWPDGGGQIQRWNQIRPSHSGWVSSPSVQIGQNHAKLASTSTKYEPAAITPERTTPASGTRDGADQLPHRQRAAPAPGTARRRSRRRRRSAGRRTGTTAASARQSPPTTRTPQRQSRAPTHISERREHRQAAAPPEHRRAEQQDLAQAVAALGRLQPWSPGWMSVWASTPDRAVHDQPRRRLGRVDVGRVVEEVGVEGVDVAGGSATASAATARPRRGPGVRLGGGRPRPRRRRSRVLRV